MAIDRRDAVRVSEPCRPSSFGRVRDVQEAAIESPHNHDLAVTGNAQLGDFCFFQPFALSDS